MNTTAVWSMASRMLVARIWEEGDLCHTAPLQEHIYAYSVQFTEYEEKGVWGQRADGYRCVCVFSSKDFPSLLPHWPFWSCIPITVQLPSFLTWTFGTKDRYWMTSFPEYRHFSRVSLFIGMGVKIPGKCYWLSLSCIMRLLAMTWQWGNRTVASTRQVSGFIFTVLVLCVTFSSSTMSVTFKSDENLNFSY